MPEAAAVGCAGMRTFGWLQDVRSVQRGRGWRGVSYNEASASAITAISVMSQRLFVDLVESDQEVVSGGAVVVPVNLGSIRNLFGSIALPNYFAQYTDAIKVRLMAANPFKMSV